MLAGALPVAFDLPELGPWQGTHVHNSLGAAMALSCCHRSYIMESRRGRGKRMFLETPVSGYQQVP